MGFRVKGLGFEVKSSFNGSFLKGLLQGLLKRVPIRYLYPAAQNSPKVGTICILGALGIGFRSELMLSASGL